MTYLEDRRPSGDSVVRDGVVAAGEHNVGLARNGCSTHRSFWDLEGEAAIDGSCPAQRLATKILLFQSFIQLTIRYLLREYWAGDCDECSIHRARSIRSFERVARCQGGNGSASGDIGWIIRRGLEHGKSLDGQSRVFAGARNDEWCG